MKMPFGKYQDRALTEVPRPYLRWLRGHHPSRWGDGNPPGLLRGGSVDEAGRPPEERGEENTRTQYFLAFARSRDGGDRPLEGLQAAASRVGWCLKGKNRWETAGQKGGGQGCSVP